MAFNSPTREELWPGGRDVYAGPPPPQVEFTFADLPADPFVGQEVNLSNANTAVWGANITGTGANHVLARWNGSNWTVVGK